MMDLLDHNVHVLERKEDNALASVKVNSTLEMISNDSIVNELICIC